MNSRRCLCFRVGLLTVLLGSGCTDDATPRTVTLVPVQGTVTRQGRPVPSMLVIFSPVEKEGTRARGITDARGRYQLEHESKQTGAEPGRYNVLIRPLIRDQSVAARATESPEKPVRAPRRHSATVPDEATTIDFDIDSTR